MEDNDDLEEEDIDFDTIEQELLDAKDELTERAVKLDMMDQFIDTNGCFVHELNHKGYILKHLRQLGAFLLRNHPKQKKAFYDAIRVLYE